MGWNNFNEYDLSANVAVNIGVGSYSVKFDFREHRKLNIYQDKYYRYENKKRIREGVQENNVSLGYSYLKDKYRISGSIGIGYIQYESKFNCMLFRRASEYFGDSGYYCESQSGDSMSIPITIDIIFGKTVGIGVQGYVSFSEYTTIYSLGLIVPIGVFN